MSIVRAAFIFSALIYKSTIIHTRSASLDTSFEHQEDKEPEEAKRTVSVPMTPSQILRLALRVSTLSNSGSWHS
jgi:hypothetical protein